MSGFVATGRGYRFSLALGLADIHLGIDIGGSGVKYSLVDTTKGVLTTERLRIKTPQPATPQAVTEVVAEVIGSVESEGPVGIGFPAVVWEGEVFTANNIDEGWIGENARDTFSEATGREIVLVNDADAAGLAESAFGAARDVEGLAVVITFGTGIGSGAVADGNLVQNLELGVLELDGHFPAEDFFAAKVRKLESLSWQEWGLRANRFLTHVNSVLNPRLIVFGGGVAKKWDEFSEFLDESLPVVPAGMGNNAGLIGAALAASRR